MILFYHNKWGQFKDFQFVAKGRIHKRSDEGGFHYSGAQSLFQKLPDQTQDLFPP